MAGISRRQVLRSGVAAGISAAAGLSFPSVLRAQGKPLKIGLLLPYSKVYAVLGESITDGMRVVFAGGAGDLRPDDARRYLGV